MQEQEYWQAVLERNRAYDARFVFAVRSTGVYCRPSCPSRHPRRENIRFFQGPAEAEKAGFRACLRCRPNERSTDPVVDRVQQICAFLAEPHENIPTLQELARRFNQSPYHLQRTFKSIVGVSPRQYAAAQRLKRLKEHLRNGETVTDALYEAGYQSSSVLYDQSGEQIGMTPGRYRRRGEALTIEYALAPCPLGWLLMAATERGICAVRLGNNAAELESELRHEFSAAALERNDEGLHALLEVLLGYLQGEDSELDLPLDIRATAFQSRVWQALRKIPYGSTRSYAEVAREIGEPDAVRAVAHACATNPAAVVIPCHRVIRQDGDLGGYRWGLERKKALLAQERQKTAEATP